MQEPYAFICQTKTVKLFDLHQWMYVNDHNYRKILIISSGLSFVRKAFSVFFFFGGGGRGTYIQYTSLMVSVLDEALTNITAMWAYRQDTLLSWYLSPPRCINGYRHILY